jgi:hypothetical protein
MTNIRPCLRHRTDLGETCFKPKPVIEALLRLLLWFFTRPYHCTDLRITFSARILGAHPANRPMIEAFLRLLSFIFVRHHDTDPGRTLSIRSWVVVLLPDLLSPPRRSPPV